MAHRILYSLVARGSVVLVEHSADEVRSNANLVAGMLLTKISQEDGRRSFTQDRHVFHLLISNGITFLCMADEEFGKRIPAAYLDDIRDRFLSTYGHAVQSALAYEYNTDFSKVLKQRAEYFSDPKTDSFSRTKGSMTEVKNIMIDNIEKVLDRGERIELLVDKTEHLQQESMTFRREARRLKNKMWWQDKRLLVMIGAALLVILYIIIAVTCSPTFHC